LSQSGASNLNHFDVIDLTSTEFGKITQNNGHYAVKRYSKLPFRYQCKAHMLLPICVNNTNLHSRTVSKISWIVGPFFAVERVSLSLTQQFAAKP